MKHRGILASVKGLLAAAGLMVIGVSQAHAVDGKEYAGSACVPYGTNNRYPSYNFSAIGNPSATQWLYLDCPAVHDARNISSGWVRVMDLHYYSDVTCSLNSIYFSGGAVWGWGTPERSSVGSSANTQQLAFGGVGASDIAHYYYSCRIPPTFNGNLSYITSYQVIEND